MLLYKEKNSGRKTRKKDFSTMTSVITHSAVSLWIMFKEVTTLKIGIFASELSKVLCGRPFKEIEGSMLRDYTSKAIKIMKRWRLSCAEFGVKFNQLEEITKVTAEEDGMDFFASRNRRV